MNTIHRQCFLIAASVLCLLAGAGPVIAESPVITQMAAQQLQIMDATAAVAAARDPATGNVSLESAPMQCALSCQAVADRQLNLCLRKAPDADVRAAGISDPPNCLGEAVQKLNSCQTACGLPPRLLGPPPSATPPPLPANRSPHTPRPADLPPGFPAEEPAP